MRDGKKVGEDDRVKVISEGNSRKLVIDKVTDKDQGEYEFRIRFYSYPDSFNQLTIFRNC